MFSDFRAGGRSSTLRKDFYSWLGKKVPQLCKSAYQQSILVQVWTVICMEMILRVADV